jgi:hypothetical protein
MAFKKQCSEVVSGSSSSGYSRRGCAAEEAAISEERYRFPPESEKQVKLTLLIRLSKVLRAMEDKDSDEFHELNAEVLALRREVNQLI